MPPPLQPLSKLRGPIIFSVGFMDPITSLFFQTPVGYPALMGLVGRLPGEDNMKKEELNLQNLRRVTENAKKQLKDANHAGVEYKALEDALAEANENLDKAQQLFLQIKKTYLVDWNSQIREALKQQSISIPDNYMWDLNGDLSVLTKTKPPIDQAAMQKVWISRLRAPSPAVYRKSQFVFARRISDPEGEFVETVTKAGLETVNNAPQGAWVVKNHTKELEHYAVPNDRFVVKYRAEQPQSCSNAASAIHGPETLALLDSQGFHMYFPTGNVYARCVTREEIASLIPGGVFMASWGEEMVIHPGDWLVTNYPTTEDVYRIDKDAFAATYTFHDDFTKQARDAAL